MIFRTQPAKTAGGHGSELDESSVRLGRVDIDGPAWGE
jgi:hypothetical protein